MPPSLFLRQFGTNSVHGAIHTTKTFYALSKKVFEDALRGNPGKGTKATQPAQGMTTGFVPEVFIQN